MQVLAEHPDHFKQRYASSAEIEHMEPPDLFRGNSLGWCFLTLFLHTVFTPFQPALTPCQTCQYTLSTCPPPHLITLTPSTTPFYTLLPGQDRHGNQYWLFFPQRKMPLVAQQIFLSLMEGRGEDGDKVNPMVLIREPTGWWGFHNGQTSAIIELLGSFSTTHMHESVLRENLLEAMFHTKKVWISQHMRFYTMQREWVDRHHRIEQAVDRVALSYTGRTVTIPAGVPSSTDYDGDNHTSHITIPTIYNSDGSIAVPDNEETVITQMVDYMVKMEAHWARCVEVRTAMHNGLVYKEETDTFLNAPTAINDNRAIRDAQHRKHKKMREQYLDEMVDHHATNGWLRLDPQGHMRELAAATTADRLHADPLLCAPLLANYKKSKYLGALVPSDHDDDPSSSSSSSSRHYDMTHTYPSYEYTGGNNTVGGSLGGGLSYYDGAGGGGGYSGGGYSGGGGGGGYSLAQHQYDQQQQQQQKYHQAMQQQPQDRGAGVHNYTTNSFILQGYHSVRIRAIEQLHLTTGDVTSNRPTYLASSYLTSMQFYRCYPSYNTQLPHFN